VKREMTVEGIFGDMDDLDVLILLLKEKNGKRFLPIGIDEAAAGYILMLMHDVKNEQPFIYDLLLRAYDECGSGIKFVVINRIKNMMLYANLVLDANGATKTVEARPTDVIALALKRGVAIYAEEEVLREAANKKTEHKSVTDIPDVFKDVINNLGPQIDELDKPK